MTLWFRSRAFEADQGFIQMILDLDVRVDIEVAQKRGLAILARVSDGHYSRNDVSEDQTSFSMLLKAEEELLDRVS